MDEIDLKKLFVDLYNKRYPLLLGTTISFVLSLGYYAYMAEEYTSSSLIFLTNSQNSSMNDNLSNLSQLAGINLISKGDSKLEEAKMRIESRLFIINLIDKYEFRNYLLSNKTQEEEVSQNNLSDETSYQIFSDMLEVIDEKNGSLKLSLTTLNPNNSKYWLEKLIEEIDDIMKKELNKDIVNMIDYLNEQLTLNSSKVSGVGRSISMNIQQQMVNKIFADESINKTFKVIDPPNYPEFSNKPIFLRYIIFSLLISFFMFSFLILIIESFRKNKK